MKKGIAVVPKKNRIVILVIDENRRFAPIKDVLLKKLLSLATILVN